MAGACKMGNENVLVTIEVPIWNGEPFIKNCISAILLRTHKNIEVIIHDNGSDDKTYELLEKFIAGDPRFSVIKVPFKQAADPSRNEAARLAKGEYICFLDVDDTITVDYVEKLLDAVIGHDFAYCNWLKVFPGGSKEVRRAIREDDQGNVFNRESVLALQKRIVGNTSPKNPMDLDLFSSICGKIYRRSIIVENDLNLINVDTLGGANDALFNFDFLEYAQSGAHVDEPLYIYLSNPNSYTHTQKIEKIEMFPKQYRRFEEKIALYNKGDEYLLALKYRIFIQSFGAFIIASSSGSSKERQKEVLSQYFDSEYLKDALKFVSAKTFAPIFKPFFRAIIKRRLNFALFYINLALKYRNKR